MKRKALSLLLAVLLLITILPTSVFAVSEGDFSLTGGAVTVDGIVDQTIDVAFQANSETTVVAFEGVFSKTETADTEYIQLTKLTPPDGVTLGSYDTNSITSGRVAWVDDVAFAGYTVTANGAVWTAQYTVSKDTPSGTYTVQFSLTDLCDETFDSVLSSKVYTATITVTNNSQSLAAGYTAAIGTTTGTVDVGDVVYVTVNVGSNDQQNFASSEVRVTYDTGKLTFNEDKSTLNGATVDADAGTMVLEDYGENQSFGTAYTLAFTAVAKGEATVTLTSAAFSTQANAEKSDLIPAEISFATVEVTVEQSYSVTLPDIFKGDLSVKDGDDYTFYRADDAENYDYEEVTATFGGQEVDVIENGDGSYTVKNVTGELVITGERSGKKYTVTIAGSGKDDVTANTEAQFGADYSFTMPTSSGYTYELVSIKYKDGSNVSYERDGDTVKILGTNITTDFTITINKEIIPPTVATVKVEGNAASDVTAATSAVPGTDFTFTLTKDSNYDYVISATVNGNTVSVTESSGTYSIASSAFKAGDTIVITANKSVKTESVSVTKYVTVDNGQMWLISIETEKLDGSVFTYKGNNMFWSEKYGAYCYVIVSADAQPAVAASDLAIITGTATVVDYGMDVNMSGKVDANDAQLTYNMYNVHYNDFTEDVTVEKFLRADVNGDGTITTQDAAAIIDHLLS